MRLEHRYDLCRAFGAYLVSIAQVQPHRDAGTAEPGDRDGLRDVALGLGALPQRLLLEVVGFGLRGIVLAAGPDIETDREAEQCDTAATERVGQALRRRRARRLGLGDELRDV